MDRNYEQEYKKAFEAAKGLHDAGNALTKKQMEIVFPELAESEDERIRKWLVDYFTRIGEKNWIHREFTCKQIVAYLEKQKEQKPAEWILPEEFEEAVYKVANFISPFDSQEELRKVSHRFAEQLLSLAKKELDKPAEWSEEDELMIKCCLRAIEHYKYTGKPNVFRPSQFDIDGYLTSPEKVQTWLESLRNRPKPSDTWKPSDEQMKALLGAEGISRASGYPDNAKVLASLYEELKRLRG